MIATYVVLNREFDVLLTEQSYGIQTKTYAMDYTQGNQSDYSNLGKMIDSIEVGVLGKSK